MYRGRQYGSAVDIFSFGIIIYFLLTGKDPHEGMSIRQYACDVGLYFKQRKRLKRKNYLN